MFCREYVSQFLHSKDPYLNKNLLDSEDSCKLLTAFIAIRFSKSIGKQLTIVMLQLLHRLFSMDSG